MVLIGLAFGGVSKHGYELPTGLGFKVRGVSL